MDELDVGLAADPPPAADIFPIGPEGPAVAVEPFAEIGTHIGGRTRNRGADATGRFVERVEPDVFGVEMMVVHAPDDVAPVAPDVDIFGDRRDDERIDRQMRLEE